MWVDPFLGLHNQWILTRKSLIRFEKPESFYLIVYHLKRLVWLCDFCFFSFWFLSMRLLTPPQLTPQAIHLPWLLPSPPKIMAQSVLWHQEVFSLIGSFLSTRCYWCSWWVFWEFACMVLGPRFPWGPVKSIQIGGKDCYLSIWNWLRSILHHIVWVILESLSGLLQSQISHSWWTTRQLEYTLWRRMNNCCALS